MTEGMCRRLAKEIMGSGFRPDYIVGIGRGGWVPARILSDIFGIDELYSMGMKFYMEMGRRESKPVITQDFPREVTGRRVLVVDDVADSGRSLALAVKRLGRAAEVRTATLHFKAGSIVRPDFFAKETDAWIWYPWEKEQAKREMAKLRKSL